MIDIEKTRTELRGAREDGRKSLETIQTLFDALNELEELRGKDYATDQAHKAIAILQDEIRELKDMVKAVLICNDCGEKWEGEDHVCKSAGLKIRCFDCSKLFKNGDKIYEYDKDKNVDWIIVDNPAKRWCESCEHRRRLR